MSFYAILRKVDVILSHLMNELLVQEPYLIREFLAKYAKNPAAVKSSLGLGMSGVSMSDQPSKSGTYVNLDHAWTGDLLSTSGE